MNIWILNHHARETGRHPSFAEQLTILGEDVTLFSAGFLHNEFKETKDYHGKVYTEETTNDYNRVYIKTIKYRGNGYRRLFNQLSFAYNTYRAGLKKNKQGEKPDIVIGSSVHLFTGLTGYLLAKRTKAKFVFEIRDLWPQTLVDLGALKEKSIITKLFYGLEKFLYKKANLIISVLPDADIYIEKMGIDKDKICHIPNGLDIDFMEKSLSDISSQMKIDNEFKKFDDKFVVTFTGSHGIANGLNTVVEAAKILQDKEKLDAKKTHFILVGEGPEKSQLIKMAKEYALTNITFQDKVPKSYVPHILNNSDVCLFHLADTPVFRYGISSNKLFDYMYSGKPVIFAVNASNDFAELAKCGITVEPENPDKLVSAITKLKNTENDKLIQLGMNGKQFVLDNHSFKQLSLKLRSLFKKNLVWKKE